tara:strand:- start:744 stop:1556 length:813 start_codon:yes stop_codon:yes gene_type:complete
MKNDNNVNATQRAKYWNESYVKYWKERVKEANDNSIKDSKIVDGDKITTSDEIYDNAISFLKINKNDNVLELGCGFGRSLPLLSSLAKKVTAVDISVEMINAAKSSVIKDNIVFYVSPSENLPSEDNTYDVVVCFAAFDAMYQQDALAEINRISKIDARILITGKNDNYDDDDCDAMEAELGAKSKGHPNYFTDVKVLLKNIGSFGFELINSKYFLRRGDLGSNLFEDKIPDSFYEYLFVLKKKKSCYVSDDLSISNDVSKTYLRSIDQF